MDLVEEITATPRPADGVVSAFFRARRYIGSKDRRAIGDEVWRVIRTWARTGWWVQRALSSLGVPSPEIPTWDAVSPRHRVLVGRVLQQAETVVDLEVLCSGDRYAPTQLSSREKALIRALRGRVLTHTDQPDWVRHEMPEWVLPLLSRVSDGDTDPLLQALNAEAPITVRVNTLKASLQDAVSRLQEDGIPAASGRFSPLALHLEGRAHIAATPTFQNGWVEVQDEGSQMVALLSDARPGMTVVDFCAGAGGKTLALAAAMQNKGRLIACDVSQGRLDRSGQRLKRAGVHNVTSRLLSNERDKWVKRARGTFDRVLVDAPCSGTGTWRRNPDARWRWDRQALSDLVEVQRSILTSAARLVKPGGRLIYATCSLLRKENEAHISWFLEQQTTEEEGGSAHFRVMDVADVWAHVTVQNADMQTPLPLPEGLNGPFLHMDPAQHGTDGFFVAVLERVR